jgi:SAM-dependent methyltransferase
MSEYDRWQSRFAAKHYVFGTEPNAFLKAQAHRLEPGMRVLCIADGEGRNGVWLARQGMHVTSQDFSSNAQDKARALAAKRDVSLDFVLADITEYDWPDGTFDAVVGIFFQFLGPDARSDVFRGIRRAVRPGGLILIEGYGPKQLGYATGGPKVLENLYTEEILRDAFGDLTECEITAYDAEVQEGPGHSGMSALVDMVARR